MTAETATCRHCGKGIDAIRDATPSYWFHVDPWPAGDPHGFRSVFCDPFSGGRTRAEPAPAAPPAVEPAAWLVEADEPWSTVNPNLAVLAREAGHVVRPLFLSSKVVER